MEENALVRSKVFRVYPSLNKGEVSAENLASKSIPSELSHDHLISAQSMSKLTQSERQIIVGLFFGLSAKEIAIARGSSNRTVEGHVASIRLKMGGERLSGIILSGLFEDCLAKGFG